MERPSPYPKKEKLSPAGEQRLRQAAAIHCAIWSDVFHGRDVLRIMAPDRQGVIEVRIPRIEQMLDFVRRYLSCTINGKKRAAVEAAIPPHDRAHAQYNIIVRAPLSQEFVIDDI